MTCCVIDPAIRARWAPPGQVQVSSHLPKYPALGSVSDPAMLRTALLALLTAFATALPASADGLEPSSATAVSAPAGPVAPPPPLPPPAAKAGETKPPPPPMRTLRAARRQGPIVLDGRPDEAAWLAAEEGNALTQRSPDEGKPASEATRFRVLWDDEYFWIGVECDDAQPPTAPLSRRDRWVEGDWVNWDLDTTFDRRTAYHFSVNAGGHLGDGLHFNDTEFTTDWDTAWEAEVARTPKGWSLEARVPLRALRIPEGAKQFGFNLFRRISRNSEEDHWRFTPKGSAGDASLLGTLVGIEGIKPIRALELKPFVAVLATRTWPPPAPGVSAPFSSGLCTSKGFAPQMVGEACFGLDLRYNLASDLTLVATVNPDFGQVEADARVLNLSTFETFFPEKRPFFTEGLDLFRVPLQVNFGGPLGGNAYQLFYSRRIGRPTPEIDLLDGQTLVHQPAVRPVAVAAKITGTVGPVALGALSSLEPRVYGHLLGADGATFDQRAAEAVHSGALRARVPFADHFLAGVSLTAVDPLYAPGARHAHVGSADVTISDDDRVWTLGGQVAGSLINGGDREVLRDGTVVDGSGGGTRGAAGSLLLKRNGEKLGLLATLDLLTPGFTTNDLGYMPRANMLRELLMINLRDPHPEGWRQLVQFNLWARNAHDAALDRRLQTDFGLEGFVQLSNSWAGGGGTYVTLARLDDRELSDGTAFERAGNFGGWVWVESDRRTALSFDANAGLETLLGHPGWSFAPYAGLIWRPLPALELTLGLGLTYETGDLRNVRLAALPFGTDPGDPESRNELDPEPALKVTRQYLMAPLTATSLSATARGTFAFSPRLTLQAYAQLFTAAVTWGDAVRAVVGPGKGTVRYGDYQPVPAALQPTPDELDSGDVGLNLNLILRWEWRLGSTFYLVYAHQSSGTFIPKRPGFDPGLGGLSGLGRDPASSAVDATRGDTILVKIDLLGAL